MFGHVGSIYLILLHFLFPFGDENEYFSTEPKLCIEFSGDQPSLDTVENNLDIDQTSLKD